MFSQMYIACGIIFKIPRIPAPWFGRVGSPLRPTLVKLVASVGILKNFFGYMTDMSAADFASFAGVDWGNLIMGIVLGVRLSFPLPECPGWDHAWARQELRFSELLGKMCDKQEGLAPSSARRVDVLSASIVVIRTVKAKFDKRLARFEQLSTQSFPGSLGCPMLDGSLQQYFPMWDAELAARPIACDSESWLPSQYALNGADAASQASQPVFHDLWATMTMGWTQDDEMLQDPQTE